MPKFSKNVWLVLIPFADKESAERNSKESKYSNYVIKVSRKYYHKIRGKQLQDNTKGDG